MYAQAQTAVNAYNKEHLTNLSPVQVILKLYDYAIIGCKKDDPTLAQRALNELIIALNFEHREVSFGLFRLYDYCKGCVQKRNYKAALVVLEDLRTTWAKAFNLK
jgi:flagellin-specific chaperone FliS